MSAAYDVRPGWTCRDERPADLRHGDVVARDWGEGTVDTRIVYRDGSVRVLYVDGRSSSFASTDRVVRWRKDDA